MAIVSDRLDISVMPKPLPMPWWANWLEVGDERYKLVHFTVRPKPATMRWLMEGVRRRRAAAGLPAEASIRHWWRKTSPWTWDKIRYRVITGAYERYMKFRRRRARAAVPAR